jgi:hypothetical protein
MGTSKEDKRVLMDDSIPVLRLAMEGTAEEVGYIWMWLGGRDQVGPAMVRKCSGQPDPASRRVI